MYKLLIYFGTSTTISVTELIDFSDLSNVKENVVFKNEIGRLRDIQVHPKNGKIYFLASDNLWLMEKN